jgi:multiple antibiotic resistance protein
VLIQAAKSILLVVSALFPIVDPIGGAPVFLSLTLNYDRETRRLLARRIALNSFILLVASFTVGSHVLSFFGISLPVVQVGGGLIVVASGWALLRQEDGQDRSTVGRRAVDCKDVLHEAFYPLTLPLTVGPGSISVAITLGANEPHSLGGSVLSIVRPRSDLQLWRRRSIFAMPLPTAWRVRWARPERTLSLNSLRSCWFASVCRSCGTG